MLILLLPISALICLVYGLYSLSKIKTNILPFVMMIMTGFVFSCVESFIIYNVHGLDNVYMLSKLVFIIIIIFLNCLNILVKSESVKKAIIDNKIENIFKYNIVADSLLIVSVLLTIFMFK